MLTSYFFPVKANLISVDVVNNPIYFDSLVFCTNLKLVKVDSEYTNVGIQNHPLINGSYICFILYQAGEQ